MQSIKLPLDVAKVLDEVAAIIGRKPEEIALEALLKHLEDIEDNLAVAQAITEGGPAVSLEEVMAENGISWDDLEKVDISDIA
jgi:predicted transcriptional regulator